MARKNLLPKEATAVTASTKPEKTKKETVTQDKPEKAQDLQEQKASQVKSHKKEVKVRTTIKAKKTSMVDAAFKILGDAKKPMNCKDLVEAMTTKGLWASPNGKTPANTLYSAFLRLMQNKGKAAPIRKADKGTFELNPSATA